MSEDDIPPRDNPAVHPDHELSPDLLGDEAGFDTDEENEASGILIVDDDADFAASLAGLLQLEGYRVAVAHDPDSAYACLAAQRVAVALVDIRLGVGNGVDLVRSFRQQTPDLVCVMVTAYASIETAVEALQSGAYDYLCKPFYSEDLLATVNRCFERIQLVEERRRTAEQLRQKQRMEAIGQLTNGIAHDFNNVLTILLSNLRWMQERAADRPELLEMVDDALGATQAGNDLTARLLSFGNVRVSESAIVDLSETLPSLVRMLTRTLGDATEIELRIARDTAPVDIELSQMETSLLNVALNARDAMPNGGRLIFEARNIAVLPDDKRVASGFLPGQYVALSVTDNGHGMSAAVRKRALEPLFSTKPPGHGSGLGLPMVDSFVRQSGGRLTIASAEGKGTRVSLYLPRAIPTKRQDGSKRATVDQSSG